LKYADATTQKSLGTRRQSVRPAKTLPYSTIMDPFVKTPFVTVYGVSKLKEGDWDVDAGDYEALLTTILGENKKPVFCKKRTGFFKTRCPAYSHEHEGFDG
jgi:hypothetical protein